jgi:hypothetical protein
MEKTIHTPLAGGTSDANGTAGVQTGQNVRPPLDIQVKISFMVLIRIKHTALSSGKLRNWIVEINSRLSAITGCFSFATTSNP